MNMVEALVLDCRRQLQEVRTMYRPGKAVVIKVALRELCIGWLNFDTRTDDARHPYAEAGQGNTATAAQLEQGITRLCRNRGRHQHRVGPRTVPRPWLPETHRTAEEIVTGQVVWREWIIPQM